jgi:adenine-specific DNA-methyltransferase
VLEIGAPEKDALCLDFFAGSGTFGQAVLEMNRDDDGNRRFVLVSSREATEVSPEKNICRDVCAARLRKVIEGYVSPKGDAVSAVVGGFAYEATRHAPVHRLDDALSDDVVWSWALQASDHPLVPFPGDALSTSCHQGTWVYYLSRTTGASLRNLSEALRVQIGRATIYTWAPTKVKDFIGDLGYVTVVAVPDALVSSFRRGHARAADVDDELARTEARASVQSSESAAGSAT